MPNNRRTFIKTAALSAPDSIPLAHSAQTAQEPPRKPNIVLLFADDMGMGDVSCYRAFGDPHSSYRFHRS